MLTTTQAAALLTERGWRARTGRPVNASTVKQWCEQGKFSGATHVGPPRRGFWLIPQADIDAFIQPKLGRRAPTT